MAGNSAERPSEVVQDHKAASGRKNKFLILIAIVVVAILLLSSAYVFVIAPSGGGESDLKDCMIIYDPTGGNYKVPASAAVSIESSASSGAGKGYLIENYRDANPKVQEILVNSSEPIMAIGEAVLDTVSDDSIELESFVPKVLSAVDQSSLASDILQFEFTNVEVELNCVGVIYQNHTLGIGLGDTKDFIFMSSERKPAFFTNAHVSGVVVKPAFLNLLNIFSFDTIGDLQDFIDESKIDLRGITDASDLPGFLLANTITYSDSQVLNGDVYDVIKPEEIAKLGLGLLGENMSSEGSQFILNLTKSIDEVLVTLAEKNNTIQDINQWLVLGTRELTYEEMDGIVGLNVAESDFSRLLNRLGLNFNISTASLPLHFHIGVTGDSEPTVSAYTKSDVHGLWSILGSPHPIPPVANVQFNAFALVLDFKNIAEAVEQALGNDDQALTEKLNVLANFRNPAVAFLFDRNFTNALNLPGVKEIWEYGAIAFIRNFSSSEGLLYYLRIDGVLYDSWKFLGITPPSTLPSLPLIIADAYQNVTEGVLEGSLQDIYAQSQTTSASTLVVKTDGYAVGSTVKTVASIVATALGCGEVVKYLPVDVGLYSVHNITPGAPDVFYHVPVVYPFWAQGTQVGPTYLGNHVSIKALFVRGELQRNQVANFLSRMTGDPSISDAFNQLTNGILNITSQSNMLDGYFLAFSVYEEPREQTLSLSNLYVPDAYYEEGTSGVSVNPSVLVHATGDWWSTSGIKVRFVITAPNGTVYVGDGVSMTFGQLTTPVSPTLPIFILSPTLVGTYRVDAYLMKLESLSGFGRSFDKETTTFAVFLSEADHVIATETALTNQEAGAYFDITVRIADSYGNTFTPYGGTISFSSTDPRADLPGTHAFIPGIDNGIHTFYLIRFKTAGSQSITISGSGLNSPNAILSFSVIPSTTTLNWRIGKVSGDGQSAPPGSSLTPFVVTVTDEFGNLLSGKQVSWTIISPLFTGSMSASPTTTNALGVTQSTLTFGASYTGIYTVWASLNDWPTTLVSFTATAFVGVPHHMSTTNTSANPQDAGNSFQITVTIVDSAGQKNSSYAGTLSFTSSDPNAVLPTDHTYIALIDQGAHTFAATLMTMGTQTITISGTGLTISTSVLSFDVTYNHDSLNWQIVRVSGDGQSAPRGSSLSNPFVVEVHDGFGNYLSGVEVDWAIIFEPYPLDPGSLSEYATYTDSNAYAETTLTLGDGILGGFTYVVTASLYVNPLQFVIFTATAT